MILLAAGFRFWIMHKIKQGLRHYAIPSVMEDAVTSDFAIDSEKNVWYTNWVPRWTRHSSKV